MQFIQVCIPHFIASREKLLAREALGVLTSTAAYSTADPVKLAPKRSQRMEPKELKKPNLPSEAIELYNLFIHGVIGRRAFMTEVQKLAIGGLTAATVVE